MKKTTKNIFLFLMVAVLAIFSTTACLSKNDTSKPPKKGVILEKRELTLTIGASEKLNYTLTEEANGQNLTWSSGDPNIASVSNDGTVTAINYGKDGMLPFVTTIATGTADITVKTADGKFEDTIKVTTTVEALVDAMSLPPLKDQFASYFMIGNIFNPGDVGRTSVSNHRLTRHYNILTAENDMKPSYLSSRRGHYNFSTADRMVNAAIESGFKVHGHTLLWHSQNAQWMNSMARAEKNDALAAMKKYVTDVVTHFKGRIYSWDVLNEVFPDGVSTSSDWRQVMRGAKDSQAPNPWFVAIGPDFVYEGYLAARLADPDTILYYNDYNTDQVGKATMIRDMVRDVNDRYRREYPNARRLLIEGIGMQEHHNTGVTTASIKRAIDLFRPLGVKLSVAELDILGQGWSEFSGAGGSGANKQDTSTVTNSGLISQARLYGEYFKLYMENADIIERVSFWGVVDNQSWRSRGLPLLFDPQGRAKPAYYKVVGALE